MKKYLLALIITLLNQPLPAAYAHPGGHGPVNEQGALQIASALVKQFVDFDPGLGFGKLNTSWKVISIDSASIYKSGHGYFIIKVYNQKENKSLFVLMSDQGEAYDANFSGDFPGLNAKP